MMTDTQNTLDKNKDLLLATSLQIAGRLLAYMDENDLKWCGFSEDIEVDGAHIDIAVQYRSGDWGMSIQFHPNEPAHTVDMGAFLIAIIDSGGMHYNLPVDWVETLVRSGESLA